MSNQGAASATPEPPTKRQRAIFMALALAWLPLGILVITLLRGLSFPSDPTALLSALPSLLVTAPFGLPLAWACRLIHGLQRPRMAWIAFAVLAPITAAASIVAGLLGPIGIAVYAAVLSLPAWLLYAVLRWRTAKR
ncbi:MAG: hypothetical protein OXU70_17845 [Gammaproteobacteria bacterium]|nr:hypothetical protein [Gammaproteobacteria bacterium]